MDETKRIAGPADTQDETAITKHAEPEGKAAARQNPTTRRNLLQMGAGLAAISTVPRGLSAPAVAAEPIDLPKAPNIIVLMTDQERHHIHWPEGWAEKICRRCSGSSATASISIALIRLRASARPRAG